MGDEQAPGSSVLVGMELGGTKVVCAAGPTPTKIDTHAVVPTGAPSETFDRLVDWVRSLGAPERVAALGLACFGPLDVDPASTTFGTIAATPKPGWGGVDVVGEMRRRLGGQLPVGLDTDVNAAALGEVGWGAAAGLHTVVYITVGTGIGGGLVVDGRPHHGRGHPEMGHLPVQRHPDDHLTGVCPFHADCLEGLAAGPAIARRHGRRGEDLGEQAPAAVRIEAWYLAQLVAAVTYVVSPQRVVLGGGVARLPGLLDATRDETARRLGDALEVSSDLASYLVAPGLGDRSGVTGALALAADATRADVACDDPPTPPETAA